MAADSRSDAETEEPTRATASEVMAGLVAGLSGAWRRRGDSISPQHTVEARRLHLRHDLAAIIFNRAVADPEIICNDLAGFPAMRPSRIWRSRAAAIRSRISILCESQAQRLFHKRFPEHQKAFQSA